MVEAIPQNRTESTEARPDVIRRRPPRRKGGWVLAFLVVVAAAVGGAWWGGAFAGGAASPTATTVALNFSDVVRTDLVETADYDGTLGRLQGDNVVERRSGTVTALPEAGTVLDQGSALVWIDDEPVTVMIGDLPAWRTMKNGTSGPDVLQLETGLTALGYNADGNVTVDEDFTSYTKTMVENWQADIGATEDGVVDLGEVVFLPAPIRIDSTLVKVGDTVGQGTPVVSISSDDLEVDFGLPTSRQGSVNVGDSITIQLPDLSKTTGKVTDVATVATRGDTGATFAVKAVLDDPSVADGIDEAPVTVTVTVGRADGVIAVPVTSLVALLEGGYAVEVDDGGGATHLVKVEPGFYANGMVEVNGDIQPGQRVVVP